MPGKERLTETARTPSQFTLEGIAPLPEPVRRWLTHSIAIGASLADSVELSMRGKIRLGRWRGFSAEEILTPPYGFIWAAATRLLGVPVTGFDRYLDGAGQMRWRLGGLIPVMSGAGPDITRSAIGRLAAEGTALLPTAYRNAAWNAPNPDTAVAAWTIDGQREEVRLRIGPDGELIDVLIHRWGSPNDRPYARYPFLMTVEDERTFSGITIPTQFRASWLTNHDGNGNRDGDGDGEFFRAEITTATFR